MCSSKLSGSGINTGLFDGLAHIYSGAAAHACPRIQGATVAWDVGNNHPLMFSQCIRYRRMFMSTIQCPVFTTSTQKN